MADTTTTTTVKTDLQILKNSLRIPDSITDDDIQLQNYLDSAKEYLANIIDDQDKLTTERAKLVMYSIAELLYQNRGNAKVMKDFPYTLRVLINSLRY